MKDFQYKKKTILERIECFEESLLKAKEYLETGAHAHWHGFRPVFSGESSPHKDWVKNVFIPRTEKYLKKHEKLLERIG